jgi:hypothetical protein
MQGTITGRLCQDRRGGDRALSLRRAGQGRVVLGLVGAVLLLLGAQTAIAGGPAGRVIALAGPCFVVSAGRQNPLTTGAVVNVGDTVETPAGARLKLRMSDGLIIAVASGSDLTIRDYAVDASGRRRSALLSLRLGLLRGLVTAGGSGEFKVETPVGIAAVHSTDWFIAATRDAAQVGVLNGAVTLVSRATDRSVRIPARWGGHLFAGLDPVPPRLWSRAEFDDVITRTNTN